MENAYQELLGTRPVEHRREEVRTGRASLIAQLGLYCHHCEEAPPSPGPAVICADGYVRRTPVQPYHISPEYIKRRRRRFAAVAGGVVLIAAIVAAVVIIVL